MQLWDVEGFFSLHERKMFYVGFLKAGEMWVPLCSVSNPPELTKFDTLLLSSKYEEMDRMVKAYAERLPKVEETFVHFLMREEISNIMDTYALKHLALTHEEKEEAGCGCGCGCS
jgi:hypothetical protein